MNARFTNNGCILIPKDGYEEEVDDSYSSSVVITNSNPSYSYLAWVWSNNVSGHWVAFNTDRDAIGINLSSGDSYIVVEFPKGTTTGTANWNNKERQTENLSYNGSQTIIDLKDLPWK